MIPSLLEDMNIESLIRQENLPQICSAADRLRRHAKDLPEIFDSSSLQLLDDLLAAAAEAEQTLALQRARIRYLESLSVTDELTGLLNRRGFELELSRAVARARRQNESGLLVMCDLRCAGARCVKGLHEVKASCRREDTGAAGRRQAGARAGVAAAPSEPRRPQTTPWSSMASATFRKPAMFAPCT